MDDPWGSPWAADASPPKIDLPTAPPTAHFSVESHARSPKPGGVSPWGGDDGENEDDAWGGWNDAASGKASPGWGRSPGLKPVSGRTTRQPSPDPWGTLEATPEKEAERVLDSAINMGDELSAGSVDQGRAIEVDESLNDVWAKGSDEAPATEAATEAATTLSADVPERSDSPEGIPAKALGAENRPEAVRQASKVQELVVMYDGIAKKSVSPIESPTTHTTELATSGEVSDGRADESTSSEESEGTEADTDNDESTLKSQDMQDDDSGLGSETVHIQEEEPVVREEADQSDSIPRPPPVPYEVDLSYLDELFPSTPAPTTSPEPLPDVIIDDTFASISERKAWYRLSRFGSMRKHNLGNDENYVRASWAGTEVRDQTIKIVRRWMEEDSIAGRVVLGRRTGAVGAAMFGWDSAAPQVDVGELLGRKGRHSRKVSQASKDSRGTAVSPTVAAFGWSSSLPSSPTADVAAQRSPEKAKEQAVPQTAPPVRPDPRLSIQPPAPPQSLNQALAAPVPITALAVPDTEEDNEEDDDDWGEMVSSPTFPASSMVVLTSSVEAAAVDEMARGSSSFDTPPPGPEQSSSVQQFSRGVLDQPSNQPDPWASANLDLLAGIPQPSPAPAQSTPLPAVAAPAFEALLEPSYTPDSSRSPKMPSPTPAPTIKTKPIVGQSGAHEDKVVAKILRDLPDLSYMLR